MEYSCVSVGDICVKKVRLMVVIEERVSGLNHEQNVVLKLTIKTWVIKVHYILCLWHWSAFA